MRLLFDQRQGFRVSRDIHRGTEIRRPVMVTEIPIVDGVTGTDAEVLFRVEDHPDFPGYGALYPTTRPTYRGATLQAIEVTSPPNAKASTAMVDLIYRSFLQDSAAGGGGGGVWSVTEGGQGGYVETFGTATGQYSLPTWYRRGTAGNVPVPPFGLFGNPTVYKQARGIHRFHPTRTLRVTGLLVRADWLAVRTAVRAAAGTINGTAWGNDTRGTWLFLFPVSRTQDFGKSFYIELNFLHDPKGHFPLGIYFDERGAHPGDCATEADIRAAGLPAEGSLHWHNGISMFSVYRETDFASLFAFTPDD